MRSSALATSGSFICKTDVPSFVWKRVACSQTIWFDLSELYYPIYAVCMHVVLVWKTLAPSYVVFQPLYAPLCVQVSFYICLYHCVLKLSQFKVLIESLKYSIWTMILNKMLLMTKGQFCRIMMTTKVFFLGMQPSCWTKWYSLPLA